MAQALQQQNAPPDPGPQAVPQQAAQPTPADAAKLRDALMGLVAKLERDADDRVQKRLTTEKRWIDDLRQYHGEYDEETLGKLKNAKKSALFINQTRPKANACEARLCDMLFPTDDKNWGIQPTPVPELAEAAQKAAQAVVQHVDQANQQLAQGDQQGAQQTAAAGQQHANVASQAQSVLDEARKRSSAMEKEIDDQLTECRYQVQARDVIRDACVMGTGIMKGPVAATDRARRGWQKVQQPDGSTLYQLGHHEDPRPAVYRVDPWSYFPEPDAKFHEDSGSSFERHLLTPKKMRALAKQPGFDADAIRRLLRDGPSKTLPNYLTELRLITGESQAPTKDLFQAWEYRGPITAEDMQSLCSCYGKAMPGDSSEVDPLDELQVVLWFCQGEVLKFGPPHLDSEESIYSVYNLEKDDASVWGFGIPYLMRHGQKALNAAWRMVMDNAGLSSGSQIVLNPDAIEPADGIWTLAPRKIWYRKTLPNNQPAFEKYDIPSMQAELSAIIAMAKEFIDEETSISKVAQGEQGPHTNRTMGGISILMNATNIVFRRLVKNFDDDMTTSIIRRMYDWNMQFSSKDEIKGDFSVDARGTSVLLVRETQAQNLQNLISGAGANPTLSKLLKIPPAFRKLVQSMMIPADEIVKTDEELEADDRAQAQQPPPPDPAALKLAQDAKIAQMASETKLHVAEMERDTAMLGYAAKMNLELDKVRAMLADNAAERSHKERMLAAEAAVTVSRPPDAPTGGGSF